MTARLPTYAELSAENARLRRDVRSWQRLLIFTIGVTLLAAVMFVWKIGQLERELGARDGGSFEDNHKASGLPMPGPQRRRINIQYPISNIQSPSKRPLPTANCQLPTARLTRRGGPEALRNPGLAVRQAKGGDRHPRGSGHRAHHAGSSARPVVITMEKLLAAIRTVESAGDDRAVGDGGRSRGPYQIGRAYWLDGGGDPARYAVDVWDADACRPIVLGYWRRYAPAALARGDIETLARIHNGGPKGDRKRATDRYWRRVREAGK